MTCRRSECPKGRVPANRTRNVSKAQCEACSQAHLDQRGVWKFALGLQDGGAHDLPRRIASREKARGANLFVGQVVVDHAALTRVQDPAKWTYTLGLGSML